jgi:hypothetical protein
MKKRQTEELNRNSTRRPPPHLRSCPCCEPFKRGQMFWPGSSTSLWKGEDWGVWSGQRTIRVFRDRDLPEVKEGGDEGRIGEGITDEVKYVNELCSIGTNWDVVGGVDVEDVIRRVKEVYKRTPNVWGDVGRCGRGGVGCLEEVRIGGRRKQRIEGWRGRRYEESHIFMTKNTHTLHSSRRWERRMERSRRTSTCSNSLDPWVVDVE